LTAGENNSRAMQLKVDKSANSGQVFNSKAALQSKNDTESEQTK
jgi:hypothetical protein